MVDIKSQISDSFNKLKKKKVTVEHVEPVKETETEDGRETWGSGLDFFFSALGYAGKKKYFNSF